MAEFAEVVKSVLENMYTEFGAALLTAFLALATLLYLSVISQFSGISVIQFSAIKA